MRELVQEHARLVAEAQVERVSGRLSPEQVHEVDDLARTLAGEIADSLLEEARQDRRFAAVLASIYDG